MDRWWLGAFFIPFWIHFASILRNEPRANPERRQSEPRVEATVINNYTKKNKNKGATFEKKSILISSISAQRASQNWVFDGCQKRKHG